MSDIPVPRPRIDGVNARLANDLKNGSGNSFDYNPFKTKSEDGIGNLIRKTPTLPAPTMAEEKSKTLSNTVRRIRKDSSSLAIVSVDHQAEDSPNASHINEHIGKAVAMMAVKTISKRQGITNNNSRPLAKKVRKRYVFEDKSEEVVDNSTEKNGNSPKDKKSKPEKSGERVTVNPKLDNDK